MGGRLGNAGSLANESGTVGCPTAYREFFDGNRKELLWLAGVIVGDSAEAERCVADAMQDADAAAYVAPGWIGHWVKRSVARGAASRMSAEIRCAATDCSRQGYVKVPPSSQCDLNGEILRSIPIEQICEKADVLERAVLILHVYLRFSTLDCALLVGCQESLIASVCASAQRAIFGKDDSLLAEQTDDDRRSAEEVAA